MTAKKTPQTPNHLLTSDSNLTEETTPPNNHQALHDLELENELIVFQLHQTQEELEQATYTLIKNEQEINELKKRVNRLTQRNPDFWEVESIEAEVTENTTERKTIQWKVVDTYLGNEPYSELRFKTSYHNGITGITFQRNDSSEIIFFKTNKTCQELTCLPVNGAFSLEGNTTISALGTSDWKTIKSLVPKIINVLHDDMIPNLPEQVIHDTASGLVRLQSTLNNWPNILRYDSIQLTNTTTTPEYQALDFYMENVELDSKSIADFSYRLSSVNETDKNFGQHPRLEFFEHSKSSFENWFVESDDERGRRLELRFAEPDQMDIGVWQKLSNFDRLLIAATISKLPEKIHKIKENDTNRAKWEDWIKIANMLKATLISTLNQKKSI